MMKKIFYGLAIATFCSCGGGDFEPLQLERKNYTTNELRIDGYYYCKGTDSTILAIFCYRNGMYLTIDDSEFRNLQEVELKIANTYLPPNKKNYSQLSVGLFFVEGSQIKMQRWDPVSNGDFPSVVTTGEIINDTTFRWHRSSFYNGLWKFKAFSPKPDSTNNFIK